MPANVTLPSRFAADGHRTRRHRTRRRYDTLTYSHQHTAAQPYFTIGTHDTECQTGSVPHATPSLDARIITRQHESTRAYMRTPSAWPSTPLASAHDYRREYSRAPLMVCECRALPVTRGGDAHFIYAEWLISPISFHIAGYHFRRPRVQNRVRPHHQI
jgi:hypothetical protein